MHHVGHKPGNSRGKRIEKNQYPDDTEYIEHQMGQCRPAGLCVTGQGSQVGRHGRSDILAQHQGSSQVIVNPAIGTHDQGDGHRCRRRLDDHGQYRSDQQEEQDGDKPHVRQVLHEGKHIRISPQIRRIGLQIGETHEEEGEAEDKFPDRLPGAFTGEEKRNGKG